MKRLPELLDAWAAALWTGGLWAIGYLAAPVLFYTLEDRVLAGLLAGKMFAWIAWVGLACGAWLLAHGVASRGAGVFRQTGFWLALVMLLLTLAQLFGIQPLMQGLKDQAGARDVMNSLFRDRFAAWHGIASAVYLLQSLLGLALVASRSR